MSLGMDARALLVACTLAMGAVVWATEAAEADLLPSRSACAGQQNTKAPEPRQEKALRCVIDEVRQRAGSRKLSKHRALERAAGQKAGDIGRCGFSHSACGRPADGYARKYGYASGTSSWQWGENLAWGKNKRGTARKVVKAWLNSPGHRSTLLRGSFEHAGVGLKRPARRAIWVLQLGCRGC